MGDAALGVVMVDLHGVAFLVGRLNGMNEVVVVR